MKYGVTEKGYEAVFGMKTMAIGIILIGSIIASVYYLKDGSNTGTDSHFNLPPEARPDSLRLNNSTNPQGL